MRSATPLTGGVASDIALVDMGRRRICVKFALGKLRVAEDWHAPMHRNRAEYEWLKFANAVVPESAIALYGHSDRQNGFAMEYIDGKEAYLWKERLLQGRGLEGEAERVGDVLGRIHAASARPEFDRGPFNNADDFVAIRIEPYLTFTAKRRPEVSQYLTRLADALHASDRVLVHGDASPKNIMFRNAQPVLLDAECATMGDASFDPSFCLTHLVLKSLHLPRCRKALLDAVGHFWKAYATHVDWEGASNLEARVCALVPALMLARTDGKSPVEYLSAANRDLVRHITIPLIQSPTASLPEFTSRITEELKERDT